MGWQPAMCGIAGIVSRCGPVDAHRVDAMLAAERHRGPDDVGVHADGRAALGMCRLSILDLDSPGLCPISFRTNPSGEDYVLVYNGEIYNYLELRDQLQARGHVFRTTGDSEVLLHAYLEWGDACVERFNGMFAFAILDPVKDLLFAARDRAGEKPFYYCQLDHELIFASEIKAILTQIPNPAPHHTQEFDAFEYMTGEETLFDGVRSLQPGHKLVYRGVRREFKSWRTAEYWNVLDAIEPIDPAAAVDTLDELLNDAVRLRLRADVPWGVYLSGGIDSALLAHLAQPDIAFTCHFPYGPKYDELEYAQEVARALGCEHVIVRPSQEDFFAHLDRIMYQLDVPTGSFSVFPLYMLARTAREHVKIVLSGEGADELFSGYTRYLPIVYEQQLYQQPSMGQYRPLLDYYYGKPIDRFARMLNRGSVSDDVVKAIIAPHFTQFDDVVHAMGFTDFKLMLSTLLQMEDRMAAAFGLENRSPFLDHRLIEFAFSIPGELKVKGLTAKWILKQVAARYLPEKVVSRQGKMGLIAPINIWLNLMGTRGEFDRQQYNRLCMERWSKAFFSQRWHDRAVLNSGPVDTDTRVLLSLAAR
jgi:asparagine synthase (glutamine-hydrolysing)